MSKKVVLICHVFVPTNNARSNRTFELAKELAKLGNEVVVYSSLGNYDYSDLEMKYNFKVKNLGDLIIHNINSDGLIKRNFFITVIRYFFRPLFDLREFELSYRTFQSLKAELKEKPIDLIISIAPPHSINWGVALYKYFFPNDLNFKNWVADCGDPYMLNPFHKFRPPFYFKYIEKWFCRLVDFIVIPIENGKSGYYPEFHSKIKVIPQGVDFKIVKNIESYLPNETLTFIYSGALYKDKRDPSTFLDYLSKMKEVDFKFIVYTKQHELVEPYLELLKDKLILKDYLPREELVKELSVSDFLINIENIGGVQSPSKLIDYGLSKRPILSLNSNDLDESNILKFFEGDYSGQLELEDFEKFNIKNVAQQFLECCN